MRSLMSEQYKHRIIGTIVILSFALVLLPAVMKQSNYRLDRQTKVAIQLPEKPRPIQVKVPEKKVFFETAQVSSDTGLDTTSHLAHMPQRVSAKPVQIAMDQRHKSTELTKLKTINLKSNLKAQTKPESSVGNIMAHTSKQLIYAVQLGTFARERNAEALVNQLKAKGYSAYYQKLEGKNGALYKVVVGQLKQKNEAKHLQEKLTETTKLHGFVIQTGVS